ncbi:toll/interleukin-1 receptor domain-containing protein [Gilliamella sp. Pas-s95]|uniref:toll/interleukin-1 receptor domain-containing protein n=1 Tax=Gilliamella sp. Pas-s95 TaxID=2687317 RepID=UPI001324EE69|nr:toll/interleukin-1 receptor domain-containing protein [Gilliamella sp. Pas-s95]MWN06308.1 TIR domain-containing protein [Gilliamella sp. Pas-s95]
MSIATLRNNIARIQKDISDIQSKIANEQKKVSDFHNKINQINRSITKNTPLSTLKNKFAQMDRYSNQIVDCQKKLADFQKKIASKNIELNRQEIQLNKELIADQKKKDKAQLELQKQLTRELQAQQKTISNLFGSSNYTSSTNESTPIEYDVFISHASEDKDDFVRPLAEHLTSLGLKVWYDELTLNWGDKLGRSIDKGLINSRYSVVVLSKHYINKHWTQYELEGLLAKEVDGHKVILPIWHNISKNELLKFSPTLANTLALNSTTFTFEEIADKLKALLQQSKVAQ